MKYYFDNSLNHGSAQNSFVTILTYIGSNTIHVLTYVDSAVWAYSVHSSNNSEGAINIVFPLVSSNNINSSAM